MFRLDDYLSPPCAYATHWFKDTKYEDNGISLLSGVFLLICLGLFFFFYKLYCNSSQAWLRKDIFISALLSYPSISSYHSNY